MICALLLGQKSVRVNLGTEVLSGLRESVEFSVLYCCLWTQEQLV